jgi:hypothetical protein
MTARTVLYALAGVVSAAAAVSSFGAMRDLARLCGFVEWQAWLLPVVIDAGAAAGSLVWLGGWAVPTARTFARALALALIGGSIAANALGHGLAAFAIAPPWWVVVIVSAVAPAVLGAVVHLTVLAGREHLPPEDDEALDAELLDEHGLSRYWQDAPPATTDRATELIAEGAGRRRLSRELDITEYEARQLLARTRGGEPVLNGSGRPTS